MPAFRATAPGKIILFGEHAVVYGQPALAVPVPAVQAQAIAQAALGLSAGEILLDAPAVGLKSALWRSLPPEDPLARAVALTLEALHAPQPPAVRLKITSTIPVAAGLGSGAAVTVALVRALSGFLGAPLPDAAVNAIAYEVEKIHHGTPSGIDNTVVTYARPVYFVRGRPLQPFRVGAPLTFVIADSGIPAPTAQAVADVRRAAEADPEGYAALFATVGEIANHARDALARGDARRVGTLMSENHALLQKMEVSCRTLDTLVQAAHEAGAWGAKLSGGGRGGNMLALAANAEAAEAIAVALQRAGAVRTIITTLQPSP